MKVALEFFQITNQSDVHDMLSTKYIAKEILQTGYIILRNSQKSKIAVAWLEGQIYYVTGVSSNSVDIYHNTKLSSWSKIGYIEVKGMQYPSDMTASQLSRSIFISDIDNRCLWMIKMSDEKISRRGVDGEPYSMSISPSDVLIVCVVSEDRHHLNLYRSLDGVLVDSISLPTEVKCLKHAIQLLNMNFLISYSKKNDSDLYLISELSLDGMNIVRSINPRSLHEDATFYWNPCFLLMDEDENIFIVDNYNNNVVLMNSRWTDFRSGGSRPSSRRGRFFWGVNFKGDF